MVVVGLSVDYTVHICNSYVHGMKVGKTRQEVLTNALVEIGISIFSGAVTTATSIFMLFFTTITFFTKFGQFVFANIVVSIIFAFTLMCALLAIGGPLGTTGSIYHLFKRFCNKIRKSQDPI